MTKERLINAMPGKMPGSLGVPGTWPGWGLGCVYIPWSVSEKGSWWTELLSRGLKEWPERGEASGGRGRGRGRGCAGSRGWEECDTQLWEDLLQVGDRAQARKSMKAEQSGVNSGNVWCRQASTGSRALASRGHSSWLLSRTVGNQDHFGGNGLMNPGFQQGGSEDPMRSRV